MINTFSNTVSPSNIQVMDTHPNYEYAVTSTANGKI